MIQSNLLQNKSYKGPVLQSVIRMSDWGELRLICASERAETLTDKRNIWYFSSEQHWQLQEAPLILLQLSVPACTAPPPFPAVQTQLFMRPDKEPDEK